VSAQAPTEQVNEQKFFWLLVLLVIAIIGSALSVIYAQHINRKSFTVLQALQLERDEMNIEWGQLQLEQSTFATHNVIERAARERLGMELPNQKDIEMLRP